MSFFNKNFSHVRQVVNEMFATSKFSENVCEKEFASPKIKDKWKKIRIRGKDHAKNTPIKFRAH